MQRYNGSGNPQINGNFIKYEDYLKETTNILSCCKCNTPLFRNSQNYCSECGNQFTTPKTLEERTAELEAYVAKLILYAQTGQPWEG